MSSVKSYLIWMSIKATLLLYNDITEWEPFGCIFAECINEIMMLKCEAISKLSRCKVHLSFHLGCSHLTLLRPQGIPL